MGTNCMISIGNSDDKLSQAEWARFVMEMRDLLCSSGVQIHGEWFSLSDRPWQNANWCVEVLEPEWWRVAVQRAGQDENAVHPERSASAVYTRNSEMARARRDLKDAVRDLCYRWRQDSFAWTEAPVEVVETGFPTTPKSQGDVLPFPPDVSRFYLNEEDYQRIREVLTRNQQDKTRGEDKDSDPKPPASTGDGDAPEVPGWNLDHHEHAAGWPCPAIDCEHNHSHSARRGPQNRFVLHPQTAQRIAELRQRSNARKEQQGA